MLLCTAEVNMSVLCCLLCCHVCVQGTVYGEGVHMGLPVAWAFMWRPDGAWYEEVRPSLNAVGNSTVEGPTYRPTESVGVRNWHLVEGAFVEVMHATVRCSYVGFRSRCSALAAAGEQQLGAGT
jgi:hypothetical protein